MFREAYVAVSSVRVKEWLEETRNSKVIDEICQMVNSFFVLPLH